MSELLESLSDVVARQVVRLRKRRDLNREQLAERLAALGYASLTAPALANIETGRRDAAGRRRRDVTVEEAVALARALDVPPLLLILPVGQDATSPILPGRALDTWLAARWFTGEIPASDNRKEWEAGAAPLILFRRHQLEYDEYVEVLTATEMIDATAAPAFEQELQDRTENALRRLKATRAEMRRLGLAPPRLPEDLQAVDDQPYVFLTPEEAARTPGVRPVDFGQRRRGPREDGDNE